MAGVSSIKAKVVDYAIVEVVNFKMVLSSADQEKFEKNPEEVVTRLLKKSGQVVNRMMITKSFIERHSKGADKTKKKHAGTSKRVRQGHYHIVYPKNEKSGWICA